MRQVLTGQKVVFDFTKLLPVTALQLNKLPPNHPQPLLLNWKVPFLMELRAVHQAF